MTKFPQAGTHAESWDAARTILRTGNGFCMQCMSAMSDEVFLCKNLPI